VLTFEYVPGPGWTFHVGDILYHLASHTNFVITAVGAPDAALGGALPITARQMNNYVSTNADASFTSQLLTDTALSGYTELIDTSHDLPSQIEYGTFTSGSTNLTNVSRGDGYAADLAGYLKAGDSFVGRSLSGVNWPVDAGNTITSVTTGCPGTVTLSQPAALSGRFPIFPLVIQ
jgi:hypothetical protein